jgi:hypothetical protein
VIELILITLLLAFAFLWTRLHKTKVGDLDSFLDLTWLFPSRKRRVTYADIQPMIAKRGVCGNKGKVSPWTSKPCTCTGYEYKLTKRGTEYCVCGCQRLGHLFKYPPIPVDTGD